MIYSSLCYRFIGELHKADMLATSTMQHCIKRLLTKEDEHSLECLCTLLMTAGKDFESKSQVCLFSFFNTFSFNLQFSYRVIYCLPLGSMMTTGLYGRYNAKSSKCVPLISLTFWLTFCNMQVFLIVIHSLHKIIARRHYGLVAPSRPSVFPVHSIREPMDRLG